jgi:hypothetical protein
MTDKARGLLLGLALLAAPGLSHAREVPATAKDANSRGMALYRKKDYKGAAGEFKRAVASYEGYVQARYNLACVAALTGDQATARVELLWLNNRALFDPVAKEKFAKATKDPDLASLRQDPQLESELFTPATTDDLLAADQAHPQGAALRGAARAAAQSGLSSLPGKHDARCDGSDAKQGVIFEAKAELPATPGPRKQVVRASLRDGVALFDEQGRLIARSEPLGCFAAKASKETVSFLKVVAGAPGGPLYIVRYGSGTDANWTDDVSLFRLRSKELVPVLHLGVASNDDPHPAKLEQTADAGDILFYQPGYPDRTAYRWDAAKFKYVEYWPEH